MAPAQCPRQVLIWTLPAVAVLISFLWYKRRKASLRSDPGGTTLKAPSRRPDDQCSAAKCDSIVTADTDQVIAAIEKAVRDLETSRAIEEVGSEESEEYELVKENCDSFNHRDPDVSIETVVIENIFEGLTSTPLSNLEKSQTETILALDPSIICVIDNKSDISKLELSSDNTLVNLSSLGSDSVISLPEDCSVASDITDIISNNTVDLISDSWASNVPDISDKLSEKKSDNNTDSSVVSDFTDSVSKNTIDLVSDSWASNEESIFDKQSENKTDNTSGGVKNLNDSNCKKSNNKSSKKNLNKKSAKKISGGLNSIGSNKLESAKENKIQDNKDGDKVILNGSICKGDKEILKSNKKSLTKVKINDNIVPEKSKMELCDRVDENSSPAEMINGGVKNDAGLEQKLATLGLESSHANTENGERDSANHSPAEVMLASPSMSNFSDAHSEGSSDSGKGCSDIPDISTPPAGGSSLSGDVIPSVYEFIIPQYMVGRLIGRYGGFLHDIRNKTHTHVFIKRHPDTTKLKICAIEGAQQDIDSALEMIRQKFPLRRFPNLTLERVTFVNIVSPMCPLPQEQFQLQLIEGLNNDVILSSLVTAGHFFLQQPTHPSYQSLCQLNVLMNSVYSSPDAPPLETPLKDAICAAPAMGGWYRAQIINIDEDNKTVDVRFLDYGGFLTLEITALRKIRGDLMLLPFQAVECLLANVVPVGGEDAEWSEEARLYVQNLTCGQILQAHISEYTEQGIPLVFLYAMYCGQVVVVNQELVSHGFADAYVTEPEAVVTEE